MLSTSINEFKHKNCMLFHYIYWSYAGITKMGFAFFLSKLCLVVIECRCCLLVRSDVNEGNWWAAQKKLIWIQTIQLAWSIISKVEKKDKKNNETIFKNQWNFYGNICVDLTNHNEIFEPHHKLNPYNDFRSD